MTDGPCHTSRDRLDARGDALGLWRGSNDSSGRNRTVYCIVSGMRRLGSAVLGLICGVMFAAEHELEPCRIEVVEKGTGWPVPLVELRTTNDILFVTDNAGVVAFDEPGLLGREVWLSVRADGYEVPADSFGNRGVRFTPQPGGQHRIEVERTIVAKRLGRLTGEGIFAESQKVGERRDWKEPGVMGQDTAYEIPYGGRRFWIWGDTNVPWYPLGLFDTAGATTALRPLEKFQPPIAVEFDYFRDREGRVRNIAKMEGEGPTWVTGLITLPDAQGRLRLGCAYSKVDKKMAPHRVGLAEWNERTRNFDPLTTLWRKDADGPYEDLVWPNGHPVLWKDRAGKLWVYFGDGLPIFRCPATWEAWKDPSTWERVDQPRSLVAADGSGDVEVARGAVAWSDFRKKWVAVFQQKFGKPSVFGEIWYAEAESPEGPWGPAVKVLSHAEQTFYNPLLHADWTPAGSPILLFEGTYTKTFTDAEPTPRYEYNQMLYRLDLDDPALAPARHGR